jgi:hypothetical protein
MITNQKDLRDAFWAENEQWADARRSRKTHNDYNCTIRCAFVDFVDSMEKSGQISEKLAFRATL